jgi:predicted nuclease with TOPRIM domain
MLSQKEREINNIHKKQHLTSEMTSMLDSAYNEFNVLQDKIQKLESQVNMSKRINLEYEDLKEVQHKTSRDFEEQKIKYNALVIENQQLRADLIEAEGELKEANFHWQQLQKKVSYLEELNNDMQAVADAHKKLEGQLKRMGELESMLNVVAEERDELAKKQYKTS